MNAFFTITTSVVILQLLLGGSLTFNFINADVHVVVGLVVFIFAIATMIVSIVSKPRSRSFANYIDSAGSSDDSPTYTRS